MWNEIKSQDDMDALMREYGDFHDSCIVSLHYTSGYHCDETGGMYLGMPETHQITMLLHSQWEKPVELLFTGVRKCSIVGWMDHYMHTIYEATLAFYTTLLGKTRDDRLVVFADDEFNPEAFTGDTLIPRGGYSPTYIIAEKLCWRYACDETDE